MSVSQAYVEKMAMPCKEKRGFCVLCFVFCFVGFTITNDDVGPLDSLLALNRQRRNGKEKKPYDNCYA